MELLTSSFGCMPAQQVQLLAQAVQDEKFSLKTSLTSSSDKLNKREFNGWFVIHKGAISLSYAFTEPEMESRLSTLSTCEFGVRTSLEANRLSCPRSADTALKPKLTFTEGFRQLVWNLPLKAAKTVSAAHQPRKPPNSGNVSATQVRGRSYIWP